MSENVHLGINSAEERSTPWRWQYQISPPWVASWWIVSRDNPKYLRGRSTSFLINRIAKLEPEDVSIVCYHSNKRRKGAGKAEGSIGLIFRSYRCWFCPSASGDGCAWRRLSHIWPTPTQWHDEIQESDNKMIQSLPSTIDFLAWRYYSSWICISLSTALEVRLKLGLYW